MSGLNKLFSPFRIASSALSSERQRIDTIAENIANARTTSTPEGGPYRRKVVRFEPLLTRGEDGQMEPRGVAVARIEPDMSSPFEFIREPGHPDADANGMVAYPNVNAVMEMADMISAMRSYEANVAVQENFVRIVERALQIMR
jgi:flagellar basal-body rod protein FlgC